MIELTKEEAKEILDYITRLVIGIDGEIPVEAINKLSENIEESN